MAAVPPSSPLIADPYFYKDVIGVVVLFVAFLLLTGGAALFTSMHRILPILQKIHKEQNRERLLRWGRFWACFVLLTSLAATNFAIVYFDHNHRRGGHFTAAFIDLPVAMILAFVTTWQVIHEKDCSIWGVGVALCSIVVGIIKFLALVAAMAGKEELVAYIAVASFFLTYGSLMPIFKDVSAMRGNVEEGIQLGNLM